jgi:hypothetical protein
MREWGAGDYGEELYVVCDMARDEWWRSRALARRPVYRQGLPACQKAKGRSDVGFTGRLPSRHKIRRAAICPCSKIRR